MQCVLSLLSEEAGNYSPDKMVKCWKFYQIHLFTLGMAVILVSCHCAHQLHILKWMLNLYFYHSITIETKELLSTFFGSITWFHIHYLNTSPDSSSLKFQFNLVISYSPNNYFHHHHSELNHHCHLITTTTSHLCPTFSFLPSPPGTIQIGV